MISKNIDNKYIPDNNKFIKYLYEKKYDEYIIKCLNVYPVGYGSVITFKHNLDLSLDVLAIRSSLFEDMFDVRYNDKEYDLIFKECIKENLDDLLQKLYKGEKVKFNEKKE